MWLRRKNEDLLLEHTQASVAPWRFRNRAAAALCGLALVPGLATAQSPSITVTGGSTATVPGTFASGTYSTIQVSGTGVTGDRTTLTIDEAIEVDGGYEALSVFDGGLLNVNANVTGTGSHIPTRGSVGSGGTLNLMSGTLSLNSLELSGNSAFQRTGGSYAVRELRLNDGVAATWAPGDSLSDESGYGFLAVYSGATLELQRNLAVVEVYLSGSGSEIVRSTGTETIAARVLDVWDGANFSLISGDAINSLHVGEISSSPYPVAASQIALAPGSSTLNLSSLLLGRGGTIVGLESVPYTAEGVGVWGQRLDYRPADSVSEYAFIGPSGTLSLQKDLSLTGTYATLSLSGSAAALERNGFGVSAREIGLSEGATLTIGDGITVSRSIRVNSGLGGVAPTVVTLAESLVLSASDGVSPGISVSGSNASIVRGPGLTITATGATVNTSGLGSFTMQAGDDFTGSSVSAFTGGRLTNSGSQALAEVIVSGRDYDTDAASTYTANGPLTIGNALTVEFGGIFQANANVTTPNVSVVYGGTLDLASGTFAVANDLAVSGTMLVNRAGGAAYEVGGVLSVTESASLGFVAGVDSIAGLFLNGGSLTTSGSGGLELSDLTILNDGLLTLGSVSSVGGPGDWLLKMDGSHHSALATYVNAGSIVGLPGQSLEVVQQDGFAYVTAVPEPSALVLALGGAGIAAGLLRRRSRSLRARR